MIRSIILGAALALVGTLAQAHEFSAGTLRIIHPWARATAPGAMTGGGFLKLENKGAADRLVSASAGVADSVELHSMSMEGDVMKMQKLDKGIELPAGKLVELKPGGTAHHVRRPQGTAEAGREISAQAQVREGGRGDGGCRHRCNDGWQQRARALRCDAEASCKPCPRRQGCC
ncbi:MAG: copper chaperone PCu(A)C [Rhodocyclaceae bacterium]